MDVVGCVAAPEVTLPTLPKELLVTIFGLLSSHERTMTLFLYSRPEYRAPAMLMAPWSYPLGQSLPILAASTKLRQLTIHGPGVHAAASSGTGTVTQSASTTSSSSSLSAKAAGCVLRACIRPAPAPVHQQLPSHLNLLNLRELVINRCFYQGSDDSHDILVLDGGAVEAWAALGAALQALPLLERLDLAHTHAITYCDPARGVAAAPWPPLSKLRELSLAHDLSVQPPPPPPMMGGSGVGEAGGVRGSGAAADADVPAVVVAPTGGFTATVSQAGFPTATAAIGYNNYADDLDASGTHVDDFRNGLAAAAGVRGGSLEAAADDEVEAAAEEMEAAAVGALYGPPILTVDATHALVELLTWLPSCNSLSSLDLRFCGLEAVPLVVAHLPSLARLDLYGNPLVTMQLPGPLRILAWLRFSLDPCYDLLADMMAAEVGEEAAAAEMWTVELQAPQLEELEVESTSARALGLLWAAAAGLPCMRRLVLTDKSAEALRS
ncbi:hypothetical protein VOLCADRAFT_89919 [Volvox carteri f. nagariensis]|uniref:F-box domain-containing protein n=1 Tax=Volvox carteri f. nagariensis TaxID=3068 RepID=D8TT04_VOLCA|nr:uncharacterized protein VOLCADRAFT_89919 [Volvox carteri f. nagariensis]EFJ49569.1 hypothetical protein VOLCADRAFT_89919 [Volvox carteri f. nagariensis]|eukprot:XP_002949550.1 hypothetical protein VOLCADRAFT_89919 [Volvox carteri f. nagariensis]